MTRSIEEKVLFEYEDATRYYTWQPAHLTLSDDIAEITIQADRGNHFTLSIPIDEITYYETVERKDITIFETILGAMLSDWSGLLLIVLTPIAIVDTLIARKTLFPVARLSWVTCDDPKQEVKVSLRSRRRRKRGQAETARLIQRIADFLLRHDYSGSVPEFDVANQSS